MQIVNVVVETPKGSSEKYDLDPKSGYIKLKKIMPVGMVFPFDFGFIEGTIGEDGDPLDAIVISEIKTFSGCAIDCRIVGAVKATQQERDGEKMRNDRYIAIPTLSTLYAQINDLKDFPNQMIEEIEHFFSSYNLEAGKKFTPVGHINAKVATRLIEKSRSRSVKNSKLIQLFLPTTAENGKAFPGTYFHAVKQKLSKKFDSLSVYLKSPVIEHIKDDGPTLAKDTVLVYEVVSDSVETDYWSQYQQFLQKQFKQDDIVIRCLDMGLI